MLAADTKKALRTAVVGYSGAGKTSLLHLIAGYSEPTSGSVEVVTSAADSERRLPLYWVPETGGLWNHLRVEQHVTSSVTARAQELLDRLDLLHRRNAFPSELSLGERSRLALARALSTNAEILVMDEPLSHVDPVRKPDYWAVIDDFLRASDSSLIFSSHEPDIVLCWSKDVVYLHDGRVLFYGETRRLYEDPPDERAGRFLGPLNWFSQQECLLLLDMHSASLRGQPARPEHLEMTQGVASGEIELIASVFCGSIRRSEVLHRETGMRKIIWHSSKLAIPAGSLVKLQLIRQDATAA
ncbi:MAG: ATP-binding cassette domain-containing protein [Planctomycetota bacterium]